MAAYDWSTYIGVIGGVVGTLTGIGGFVLGIFAFRRTDQLKALDLRLELRGCERLLCSEAADIVRLLESAKASHTGLGAAQGNYHSSSMQHWLGEWGADMTSAKSLQEQVGALGTSPKAMSRAQLEARLNAVQDLQHQLTKLSGKYKEALAKDDAGLVQLRADRRVVT